MRPCFSTRVEREPRYSVTALSVNKAFWVLSRLSNPEWQRTSCDVHTVTHLRISWFFRRTCIRGYTHIGKTLPSSRTFQIHRYCYLSYIHLCLWRDTRCKACSLVTQTQESIQKLGNTSEGKRIKTLWSLCAHSQSLYGFHCNLVSGRYHSVWRWPWDIWVRP